MRRALVFLLLGTTAAVSAQVPEADAWLFAPAPDAPEPAASPFEPSAPVFPSSRTSESAWREQADFLFERFLTRGLRIGDPIHIRIFKQSRELELWVRARDGFELYRSYPICDMSGMLGPKRFEGDFQAPEGFYSVRAERLHPHSDFHLAFNLGYPNRLDRALGRTGSNIMIHGGCASNGCFAMTDYYMEQIYVLAEAALRDGQDAIGVEVYPFRMTDENLAAHSGSRWNGFWQSLRVAHDYFLTHREPARIVAGADGYRMLAHDSDEPLGLEASL